MAYFERIGAHAFRPTRHVGGAWSPDAQHIAPALGLLAHVVERDRDERGRGDLVLGRLSYDILGTVPVEPVETAVQVVRPGRTIELVEATLEHDGRTAVLLRAWLMQTRNTAAWEGTSVPRIPPPQEMETWNPSTVWQGGFIASAEVRRSQAEPGRAAYWVRTDVPLVEDEKVSRLAGAIGLFDIANGMTVRVDPRDVAFPNIDLTAHLFAEPRGEWLGFDTTVSFGAEGLGLTSSVLHDENGAFGTVNQMLTVRPG
jgi:hypothetical protein